MVKCCTNTWDRKGLRRKAEGKNRCKTEGKKGIRVEVNKDKGENRVAVIDPLRDARWDPFVESHPFGWICHLSSWKRVLEESFPHMKGHYLALINEKENTIKAALPVFEVRSWLTGNRLVSIPFATLCDPLISSQEDILKLLESTKNLSREVGAKYSEIRALSAPPLLQGAGLRMRESYKLHYLPLNSTPEDVAKTFHRESVRQAINRARRRGVTVRIGEDETDLMKLYHLYLNTRKRLSMPAMPYTFLETLWHEFSEHRQMRVLLAEHGGIVIAALQVFVYKKRMSAECVGYDYEKRRDNPLQLIFWEAIRIACEEGIEIFDFGRTSPLNKKLMIWKERWGTMTSDMPQFYYPADYEPTVAQENSMSYKLVKTLCRYTPHFAYARFGKFCYRHMG